MEVDLCTSSKEIITHGRVKVVLGKISILPRKVPLWVRDLPIQVEVEEDLELVQVRETDSFACS